MIVKPPRENAPDFVKGHLAFKTEEFVKFLEEHTKPDGWVNVDLLLKKDGEGMYGALNAWVKPAAEVPRAEITPDDSPF